MKRTLTILLALVMLLSLLASCGGGKATTDSKAPAAADADKVYTIKAAHMAADTHPWHPAILAFEKEVEEKTNGKVQVETFFGGALGYDRDLIEGMQAGTVDVAFVTTAPVANFVPEIGILDLPYVFNGWDHIEKLNGSEVATSLDVLLDKAGLVGLGYMPNGFRQTTTGVRPINKPEDFKGLKIRVMQSDMFIDTFKALGAEPVPMAWAEVPTSLQQGTIQGQENGVITNYTNRVWEFQKYMSMTSHCAYMTALLGSKVLLGKLPQEYVDIVKEAGKRACDDGMKKIRAEEGDFVDLMVKEGLEVNDIADLTPFVEVTKSVRDKFVEKYGSDLMDLIMKLDS